MKDVTFLEVAIALAGIALMAKNAEPISAMITGILRDYTEAAHAIERYESDRATQGVS